MFSRSLLSGARRVFSRPHLSSTRSSVAVRSVFRGNSSVRKFHSTTHLARSNMFCFQCEQTEEQKGCTTVGVCGKTPEVANLQDMLVHVLKGISVYANAAREIDSTAFDKDVDRFVTSSLFATMTNVNFDENRMISLLEDALKYRNTAKDLYEKASKAGNRGITEFDQIYDHCALTYNTQLATDLISLSEKYGIEDRKALLGDDYVGLQEMTLYGLKGTSAYFEHATVLGQEDTSVAGDIHKVLATLAKTDSTVEELVALALKVGEINLRVLAMMDTAHNDTFGSPEPSNVPHYPVRASKCILVSGHDIPDLEHILEQTKGKGIDVYTHGELLPAHSYPEIAKHDHLVGHFGTAWQNQKFEFSTFPGSIVMTTNCIIEPMNAYKHKIFTRSVVGYPGVTHIDGNDFSPAIEAALADTGFEASDVPQEKAQKSLTIGFGHKTVMSIADTVINAVKTGAISRFFVIGGCDGSEGERSYFTDLAEATPKDSVLLTLGCGKYRINNLDLGEIGGIPRVLDMGQCNDAYSAIQVAAALAKAFNTDLNSLPLSFAVSWFEQKAVAVLLTLLHLNIKNIRLGPHLPAFATPAILDVLVKNFAIAPIGDVSMDLEKFNKGE